MVDELPNDSASLKRRVRKAEDELARLELTLDVVGTTDLDAGILNRNGVLEALDRRRRWMARRGDVYGALVVRLPGLGEIDDHDALDTVKHIAATIAAGLREVDEVGRISGDVFAATLADLRPGSILIVASRVHHLVSNTLESVDGVDTFGVAALEVTRVDQGAPEVLQRCIELATGATDEPIVKQL